MCNFLALHPSLIETKKVLLENFRANVKQQYYKTE